MYFFYIAAQMSCVSFVFSIQQTHLVIPQSLLCNVDVHFVILWFPCQILSFYQSLRLLLNHDRARKKMCLQKLCHLRHQDIVLHPLIELHDSNNCCLGPMLSVIVHLLLRFLSFLFQFAMLTINSLYFHSVLFGRKLVIDSEHTVVFNLLRL